MSSFKVGTSKVPRLAGKVNYDQFRHYAVTAFEQEDLDACLLAESDAKYEKDAKKLKKALCYLRAGVEPELISMVAGCKSASENLG